MKKILITGINGFIGSNCSKHFCENGYDVFGIDIFGDDKENFIKGEVNTENLKSFNQEFDTIIHLAGSGTVGASQKEPELERNKTVGSTEQIFEYIKKYNKNAKLIYSSSAAVYGDSYDRPIKETDKLHPISYYGQHKVEAEELCEKYYKEYGISSMVIRFFSIYGEGLKKQLLWDFTNRVNSNITNKSIPCFGTGKEKRDFIHIKDAVALIELIMNKDGYDIFNCGTGVPTEIDDVLKSICAEIDYTGGLIYDNINKQGDPKCLVADIFKAKKIGYSPEIAVSKGISQYVHWFKGKS